MATHGAPRLLTYDDYAALPDEGNRYEVIDGVLALCPAPTRIHQRLHWRLLELFVPYLIGKKDSLGQMLSAPFDVVLDPHQVLQPDLLFVSKAREWIFTDANIQGAPDFVVEILSPGTMRRDLGRKRELYDEFGVREYWIVHQRKAQVDVLRRGPGGKLLKFGSFVPGDEVETPHFPGFVLSVAELYEGIVPAA